MKNTEIENNYTYHAPQEGQPERYERIRLYEKLVKRLRRCSQLKCNGCDYENVISCRVKLNAEAAEAIEKLSGLISRYCGETGIKSEKSKMEDHCDVSVDFGFTCEVCSLSKYNVNTVFDTGCEGDSEICERFDPLD